MSLLIYLAVIIAFLDPISCNLPPIIQSEIQPIIIKENVPVGTQVLSVLAQDPEGSQIKYKIQGTDYLEIDLNTGVISTIKKFDREVRDTINAMVTVEDQVQGGDNNVIPIPIELIILDINDNKPSFSQNSYKASVAEDAPPGTVVIEDIKLSDVDQVGDVITVQCLHEGELSKDFRVISKRMTSRTYEGSLVLNTNLSYSLKHEYRMELVASDGNNTISAPLLVKVQDVQNSPPKFLGSTTGIVSEDASIGHLVMRMRAVDQDIGNARKIMYELIENPLEFFVIDRETGELRVARPLDREAVLDQNGIIVLVINAYETVQGSRISGNRTEESVAVHVTIQDVNDVAPTFSQKEYRISIPENLPFDTPLSNIAIDVIDRDVGINSAFKLRMEDQTGYFSISPTNATGSTSVSLKLTKEGLDFENPSERKFILLIVAEEYLTEERLSSTATIIITVLDTNDNRPKFDQEVYSASVPETATSGTLVAAISAADQDSGKFGTEGIIYSLIGPGAERFGIDKISGVITIASCNTPGSGQCLDYEKQSIYFFTYEAIDENGRGLKTSVPLRIVITDINDNPPKFKKDKYEAVIQEGEIDFIPPLFVKATDLDATSILRYSIVSGNSGGFFNIDAETGRIGITNQRGLSISELKTSDIILSVEANDGIGSDLAKVYITLQDVNNNKPKFNNYFYKSSIQENSPKGTLVEVVSATDSDIGLNSEMEYSIVKGAYQEFAINISTGHVYLIGPLNYDQRKKYNIEIVASDKGIPKLRSSPAMLQIDVINSNDKSPYFTPTTQRVQVKENIQVGTVIYTLLAQDRDISSDFSLFFALKGILSAITLEGSAISQAEINKLNDLFVIKENGQVILNMPLNRNETTEITLITEVSDVSINPQQTTQGYLVVTVIDVNNHPPTFPHPWSLNYPYVFVSISEELPKGSVVTTIVASDVDSNIAEYKLFSDSDLLAIDEITGVVTVKGRLDYETEEFVNATIVVKDTGVPQLSATTTLVLKLKNINDEEPIFEKTIYEARLVEHPRAGTIVTKVKAIDKDKDKFGIVSYKLTGDQSNLFTIDAAGTIRVREEGLNLDRESKAEVIIRVVATDSSPIDMVKQSSVPVRIKLLDINDNKPYFEKKLFESTVVENLPLYPPTPIVQVRGYDKDEGVNAALSYKIIDGNDRGIFRLNSSSGFLYQSSKIDVDSEEDMFILTVEARDENGRGYQFDTAKVKIKVLPKNEYKPKFIFPPRQPFVVTIPEESRQKDLLVLTARARDADTGLNGEVRFFFREDDKNVQEVGPFRINSVSGEIRTKHKLDREIKDQYKLLLVAKDMGTPTSFETLCILIIKLNDTNDHSPSFIQTPFQQKYLFSVRENLPRDTWIGQVKAIDKDAAMNSRIYYYILNGNQDKSFYVDESNGNLFSSKTLDREHINVYELKIKATNKRKKPSEISILMSNVKDLSDPSVTTVVVTIEDENDNPPKFARQEFYAGVSFNAKVGYPIYKLRAVDDDEALNGTLSYSLLSSIFYRPGENNPVGSIVPSPFNLTKDGRLTTAALMYPYKRHRFLVEIEAKEIAPPHRKDRCKVYILVWQEEDLIKVIFEEPPHSLMEYQNEITESLSSVLEGQAVVDEIRYFTSPNKTINKDWTEILMHIVNGSSHVIPAEEVLEKMDRGYKLLKDLSKTSSIRSIYPVYGEVMSSKLDARYIGLLVLVVALFVGLILFVVFCCCLRFVVIQSTNSKGTLIQETVEEDHGLNATENPLWIDMKLKRYEEQELSMQVLSEFDPAGVNNQLNYVKDTPPNIKNRDPFCNTYATIQKSMGAAGHHKFNHDSLLHSTLIPRDDIYHTSDYDTIEGGNRRSANSSQMVSDSRKLIAYRQQVNASEEMVTRFSDNVVSSGGLGGSGDMVNRPLPEEPLNRSRNFSPRKNSSRLDEQEPCFVSELI